MPRLALRPDSGGQCYIEEADMKQLWHKAKALFGFGPQEAETPPPTAEDIAEGWNSPSMAQARAALALPPAVARFGDSLNDPAVAARMKPVPEVFETYALSSVDRLAVMAQPVVTEDQPKQPTHLLISPWGDAPNQ